MISQETVRRWYTPVEVSTLRRWLLVSVVVNVVVNAVVNAVVDYCRME